MMIEGLMNLWVVLHRRRVIHLPVQVEWLLMVEPHHCLE
jgi:hypothetical protein